MVKIAVPVVPPDMIAVVVADVAAGTVVRVGRGDVEEKKLQANEFPLNVASLVLQPDSGSDADNRPGHTCPDEFPSVHKTVAALQLPNSTQTPFPSTKVVLLHGSPNAQVHPFATIQLVIVRFTLLKTAFDGPQLRPPSHGTEMSSKLCISA